MEDELDKYSVSKGTLQFGKEEVFPKKLIRQIVNHRINKIKRQNEKW